MYPFEFVSHDARVVFGSGTLQCLPAEVKNLSATRPLLLSTPGSSGRLHMLESLLFGHVQSTSRFDKAVMHTPAAISDDAAEYAKSVKADCLDQH